MQETPDLLRFDGRVAIVTGAGGRPSLGRAYAHLLASRGARVVVNDLGVGPDGRNIERAHADLVAREITDAGGTAIADTNSVADRDSARAVVQKAIDAWGRVDILINNAGISPLALFESLSVADIRAVVGVHLLGSTWMCRAAWPHMKAQRYGRIVNIASGGMFGQLSVPVYGAAKAAVFGLTRGLAVEGIGDGIRVNSLLPRAFTIALEYLNEESEWKTEHRARTPEQVAPTVAYLSHESCSLTGRLFNSGAGEVSETFFSSSSGYANPALTPELVRDNLVTILDRANAIAVTEAEAPNRRGITPRPYRGGAASPID